MPKLADFTIIEEPGEHSILLDGSYSMLDFYWLAIDIITRYGLKLEDVKVYARENDSLVIWWVV